MGCDDYSQVFTGLRHDRLVLRYRWRVCKRQGRWRIYNPWGFWHDSDDTLVEAHTYATQLAVADELFAEGGLTRLRKLQVLAKRGASW